MSKCVCCGEEAVTEFDDRPHCQYCNDIHCQFLDDKCCCNGKGYAKGHPDD